MRSFYLDENRNVVEADLLDMLANALQIQNHHVIVGSTEVLVGIRVSTVFLGTELDAWRKDGPPSTFESAVITDDGTEVRRRYATWDDAAKGHEELCQELVDKHLAIAKRRKDNEGR